MKFLVSFHKCSTDQNIQQQQNLFSSTEIYLSCTHFGCFSSPIESIFYSIYSTLSPYIHVGNWRLKARWKLSKIGCREWKLNSRFLVSWAHICWKTVAWWQMWVLKHNNTRRKLNEPRRCRVCRGRRPGWLEMSCWCRLRVCLCGGKFD